jgi:hypothetical protein
METNVTSPKAKGADLFAVLLLLLAALSILLYGVFLPNQTLFSNDGPLGRIISECHQLPSRFVGCWGDLNGIGFNGGVAIPGISMVLQFLLKPIWFSKLYALLAQVILGLGAWCFFSQLGLSRMACFLGALAAALNSCFFAVSCWGDAAQPIAAGMAFFAMAALTDTSSRLRWVRVMLGGMAAGMAVIEASDVGAIFSVYVAAFVAYQAWMGGGTAAQRAVTGLSRLAVVVVCAGFIAAQAVIGLVGTSIVGVAGTQQDEQTKEQRWDFCTQWSLPVEETTGLIVPGLFGYRLDTPNGGAYWGRIGMDPAVERYLENGRQGQPPRGFMRYSGGGFYAGVIVVMLGVWAMVQSMRRKDSCFSLAQRRWVWFWLAVTVVSLLLAFGRFAPFYRLVYALPYFSTIRNPIKFIYLVSLALVVLFAYGADGLWRRYLQPAPAPVPAPPATPAAVNGKKAAAKVTRKPAAKPADSFEKTWMFGTWSILGIILLAWVVYAADHQSVVAYMHFYQVRDPDADSFASFSARQVGWLVLFYVVSAWLIGRILAGKFAGVKARWAGVAFGLLLVVDLGRANQPWIMYWNYPDKYASNPIIEVLRNQPYEHRVTLLPGAQTAPNAPTLERLYRLEWLQQQFPYYNIQTLDVVDMPRKPLDLVAFGRALTPQPGVAGYQTLARIWQLTGTRYVLGRSEVQDVFNQEVRQGQLRVVQRFDVTPKPGEETLNAIARLTAVPDDNGMYALFEYTAALPQAKLYSTWQVITNDSTVLEQLGSLSFDPGQTVMVSDNIPAPAPAAATATDNTNQNPGAAEITSYRSKDIVIKCSAPAASVLLISSHFDPHWYVWVDGQPAKVLRCNYIMRGVAVPAGAHTVEFRFQPPYKMLYVTLSAFAVTLLLLVVVLVAGRGPEKPGEKQP